MKIIKINNYDKNTFSARLFLRNEREIKAFDTIEQLEGINRMEKRGHKDTTIIVDELFSEPYINCYAQFAKIRISNPLFGEQKITTPRFNVTYYPAKTDDYDTFLNLDYMTGNIDYYENLALRKALITNMKNAIKKDDVNNMNPINTLNNMLNNTLDSGISFSKERIRNFECIAKDLYKNILKAGLSRIDE